MPDSDSHIMDSLLPSEQESADSEPERIDKCLKGVMQQDRLEMFDDKGYYTTIVFQCREQVQAFMAAMKWEPEEGEYWIDGMKLSKKLGIELPRIDEDQLAEAYRARPNASLAAAIGRGLQFFEPNKKGGE